ncbi:MAG: hypothetical protein SGJ27_07315 [Candidatus Melainabacteria bacterium]|nr:hypothetical protein [Candidatus Melainabacteria bacterium]
MNKFDWRKHKGAIVATALGLAFIALVGVTVLLLPQKPPPIVINVKPPERDEITYFGVAKTVFAQDDVTILEKHTPYSDGGVGHLINHPDGTIKETAEHYPLRAGASQAVLKSKSTWSADGKSVKSGEVYRPDGSLWFTYKDLGSGKRQDTFYFKDGWKFSQSEFKPDDKEKETTYYHPGGNVWGKEVQEKSYTSYSEKTLTVFDATGNIKLCKSEVVPWKTTVDGFDPGTTSGKLVSYYNQDGKRTYRQFYNSNWNWSFQIQGCLQVVHVYDRFESLKKTYEVEDAQDTVKLKTTSKPDGARKVFRDTGKFIRRVSIEKVNVQGQPKERFLQIGTCSYELDAAAARTEYEDTERVYDIYEIAYFARPAEQELRDRKTESQAESRGVLGLRDDTDPVKWYHKQ